MKNKVWVLVFALILIVLTINFISAQEGCCEKTKEGAWCQMVEQTECSGTIAPTSCDSFTQCILGTCVNVNSGQCSANVPKAACESNGGFWDPRPKTQVELNGVNVCQDGCCSFGNNVAFVSQTECVRLGSDYGIESVFDGSITDESTCFSTANTGEEGACIFNENSASAGNSGSQSGGGNWFSNLFNWGNSNNEEELDPNVFGLGNTCRRTTREECNKISNSFFEEGLLCSAPFLGTTCAKSEVTSCGYGDKVYFRDTCGNLANVYDSDMFSDNPSGWTSEMEDYWTNIKDPTCDLNANPNGCGDCEILDGNICREFSKNTYGMPSKKPDYGNYVCASMGCAYDTNGNGKITEDEKYLHGERWCAETDGTFNHLQVNPQTGKFDDKTLKELKNPDDYNLPGSRYVMLSCYDGQVIEEPCRDFRNEVCMEFAYESTGFRGAKCAINGWRTCFTYTSEDSCLDNQMCKWIPGYRFDWEVVTTQQNRNQDKQGSCLPLFAPGFEFWNYESGAQEICKSADVKEQIIYETHWMDKRDKFKDVPVKDAAQRCIDNCHLIPGYASDINFADYRDKVWQGVDIAGSLNQYSISLRKGYYCDGQGGGVHGSGMNCAGDSDKSSVYPIFLTHEEWITSITERARSLGDCGYKQSAYKELGVESVDKELELVTIMFQKLKQDGTPKDGNGTFAKLYVGGEYVGDTEGYRG